MLTPGPIHIPSFLLVICLLILYPAFSILFNISPLRLSFLIRPSFSLHPFFIKRMLFLFHNICNFLINGIMFGHLFILLILTDSLHSFDITHGSLALLISLIVSDVHIFSLLGFDHVKLFLLVNLFVPHLLLLLLQKLVSQPLLFCDLLLLLIDLLLLVGCLLCPSLLLQAHADVCLRLFLLHSVSSMILEFRSLIFSTRNVSISFHPLSLSFFLLSFFASKCLLDLFIYLSFTFILLLVFHSTVGYEITFLAIKTFKVRLSLHLYASVPLRSQLGRVVSLDSLR